jgi:hypothetical protein
MTLFAVRTRDDLLAVRFAGSPVWETQAAVQAFADERARSDHELWRRLIHERLIRLDLRRCSPRCRTGVMCRTS